jgi:hypothetical protein
MASVVDKRMSTWFVCGMLDYHLAMSPIKMPISKFSADRLAVLFVITSARGRIS